MRFASALCLLASASAACSYDFDQYGPGSQGEGGGGASSPTTTASSSSSSSGAGGGGGGAPPVRGPCAVVGKPEPFRADFSAALGAEWAIEGLAAVESGALGLTLDEEVDQSTATHASEFVLDECWVDVKIVSTGPEMGLVELVGDEHALRAMVRPYSGVPDTLLLVDDATPLGSTTQVLIGRWLRIEAVGGEVRLALGGGDSFEAVLTTERPSWLDAPVRLRLGHRRQTESDASVTIYFDDVNPP